MNRFKNIELQGADERPITLDVFFEKEKSRIVFLKIKKHDCL